jgi:hypothetical protein
MVKILFSKKGLIFAGILGIILIGILILPRVLPLDFGDSEPEEETPELNEIEVIHISVNGSDCEFMDLEAVEFTDPNLIIREISLIAIENYTLEDLGDDPLYYLNFYFTDYTNSEDEYSETSLYLNKSDSCLILFLYFQIYVNGEQYFFTSENLIALNSTCCNEFVIKEILMESNAGGSALVELNNELYDFAFYYEY